MVPTTVPSGFDMSAPARLLRLQPPTKRPSPRRGYDEQSESWLTSSAVLCARPHCAVSRRRHTSETARESAGFYSVKRGIVAGIISTICVVRRVEGTQVKPVFCGIRRKGLLRAPFACRRLLSAVPRTWRSEAAEPIRRADAGADVPADRGIGFRAVGGVAAIVARAGVYVVQVCGVADLAVQHLLLRLRRRGCGRAEVASGVDHAGHQRRRQAGAAKDVKPGRDSTAGR